MPADMSRSPTACVNAVPDSEAMQAAHRPFQVATARPPRDVNNLLHSVHRSAADGSGSDRVLPQTMITVAAYRAPSALASACLDPEGNQ